jgi:hypothetical protein
MDSNTSFTGIRTARATCNLPTVDCLLRIGIRDIFAYRFLRDSTERNNSLGPFRTHTIFNLKLAFSRSKPGTLKEQDKDSNIYCA